MTMLSLAQANAIVDRISELLLNGRNLKPVALSEVGASSTLEARNALYLVTAETFQRASLNPSQQSRAVLKRFIQSASSTAIWISLCFRIDIRQDRIPELDESLRDTETIESFVEYLQSLNPAGNDYWSRVYSRIDS